MVTMSSNILLELKNISIYRLRKKMLTFNTLILPSWPALQLFLF